MNALPASLSICHPFADHFTNNGSTVSMHHGSTWFQVTQLDGICVSISRKLAEDHFWEVKCISQSKYHYSWNGKKKRKKSENQSTSNHMAWKKVERSWRRSKRKRVENKNEEGKQIKKKWKWIQKSKLKKKRRRQLKEKNNEKENNKWRRWVGKEKKR